ncbi:hypothetical protein HVA01_33620 [Halovibrio variabilis]|uniref:Uncharacterized protein n=1 Tax=Halovibrio variabilis TaxID=31910 RepID=A0A511UT10_9GAMM|nr:hypothetical protein HVA01_33620 [Halovibrio variabilis]
MGQAGILRVDGVGVNDEGEMTSWLKNDQFVGTGVISGLAQSVRRVYTEFSTGSVKKPTDFPHSS